MQDKRAEIRSIYIFVMVFFLAFLCIPLFMLLINSFKTENGMGIFNYIEVLRNKDIITAIFNSIKVSMITSLITTIIAFFISYAINCTNIFKPIKLAVKIGISIPMFLPTITYGFAIIYSFGKQGLLTKFFGRELFQIYGFNGLLMGYVIYTLPSAFLLINNSFEYIDRKFVVVSKLMGDSTLRTFVNTVFRPLIGTIAGAFVLTFILSFTDFGIPASVGGKYEVVSTLLYQVMLGSIPDFNKGAVIAILMLLPAVFGVLILNYLEKYKFHYDKLTKMDVSKNRYRDIFFSIICSFTVLTIIAIFIVIFITPFVRNFPYDMSFTTSLFNEVISSRNISRVFKNSIMIALISSVAGTLISYCSAIVSSRSQMNNKFKVSIDMISMITNAVPGMVLGLSYLLAFNGSGIKGTFAILIICNLVHFFTTPYLMAKNSLSKLNQAWETTGELLGDTMIKTMFRIIIPNSLSTIVAMFGYYFINSMVTISAVIFLVTARTAVVTSKIKELQHFGNFNEIFVLSILIFITNISFKIVCDVVTKKLSIHQ